MSLSSTSFIKGAAILALTGLAARGIGAIFRIVLAAILGDEGIGLFMYAYPIYSTLLILSTAGIPVAVSKIMAEKIALHDYLEALRVFKVAFTILTITGLGITLVLALGAELFASLVIRDMQAVYPLLAISPAIFFVTIMAALRGFFQGQQNMVPTAASQMLEQLVRVVFSLILVFILLPVGLEYAAAGASSGAAAGGLAGLILLAILYRNRRRDLDALARKQGSHEPAPVKKIISRLFGLAVPVTIGGLVIPLMSLIDLVIVPRQLQAAGFDLESSRALYGQLTGMAGPVVYFPNVVALALSISLVPVISEALTLGNKIMTQNRSAVAIKLTVLFSVPASVGLFLLAEPVTLLLYNNAEAGYSLAYLSWSVVPLCLYVTTTGILQGLGKPILPALNMFYGGIVKIILAWFLTAVPALNVGGAAIATVAGVSMAAALNLFHVARYTGWRGSWRELFLLPVLSVSAMSLVVILVYNLVYRLAGPHLSPGLQNGAAAFAAIAAGAAGYGACLLLSGSLSRAELQMMPFIGARLAVLTDRFGRNKSS